MRRASALRRAAAVAATGAIALLAGCGSVPLAPSAGEGGPVAPEPSAQGAPAEGATPGARPGRPAARPPAAGRGRGGGYYLDDGPGDRPPADLDAVADAVPRAEPPHPSANRPYVVFGRQYVPVVGIASHRERGVASWYGRKFHGRPTSSGERYDMYGMTAAHPTLPIPSYVRVTNVRNGRSVVVRVNDRGPFLHRRVIDLSYAAAWKLGFAEAGSAQVEVELVVVPGPRAPVQTAVRADVVERAAEPVPAPPAPAPMLAEAAAGRLEIETTIVDERPAAVASIASPAEAAPRARSADDAAAARGATWLQLGAFASRENAEAARVRAARELPWLAMPIEVVAAADGWRVQVGPWTQREDARAAADRIASGSSFRPVAVVR
ncbi:MAG TPA: septal ring lytic transglycosylase RlpA family protein [Burkholderiaceae bacterium]|nr:septal ring lytic transglycosylase RlpA family protein [Burkholderiaceae bacterium]